MIRVLIACERFGVIRDAFINAGHDAMSCDLVDTAVPGPHYTGDVRDILDDGWDLMIAHPDCTYLCSSGLHWNHRVPGRAQLTEDALDFVRLLMAAPISRIAIENPMGRIGTAIRKADQTIQPYEFGDNASKRTGLWLKNLPLLKPTGFVEPRLVCQDCKSVFAYGHHKCLKCGSHRYLPRWDNQTDSGQNKLGPSEDRAMLRAKTYQGWADAMADQWGRILKEDDEL